MARKITKVREESAAGIRQKWQKREKGGLKRGEEGRREK